MRGTDNLNWTTSGDASNGRAGTNDYVGFISTLESPYTMKPGKLSKMKIAFDLSAATNFFEAGGQDCYITPSSPSVTVSFVD